MISMLLEDLVLILIYELGLSSQLALSDYTFSTVNFQNALLRLSTQGGGVRTCTSLPRA